MKYRHLGIALIITVVLLGGCQPATTPEPTEAPTEESSTASETEEVVLDVVGLDGSVLELTMAEVQALESMEAFGGFKTSVGDIIPPAPVRGVTVNDLCALVGGLQPGTGVRIVAEDGYAMTLSYDQVANGDFITYDPATGEETTPDAALHVIVAFEREGQPLPAEEEGTLRLAVVSDDRLQVTDGHWWVKWVRQVVLIPIAQDWSLHLEGAITEEMDRNTFESCGATSCHQSTWTDDEGQVWSGAPLWYIVGRVDDEIQHDGPAFNRTLAAAGYTVEVIAADGFAATFDIENLAENNDIIVAHLLDDSPLGADYFPLRIVGPDLSGREKVSQIAQILLHLPEQEVEGWMLQLEGAVAEELDQNTFASCGAAACHQASWTDEDGQVWSGVPLWNLVGRVDDGNQHEDAAFNRELANGGYEVEIIAADGYSVNLDIDRIREMNNILVAYLVNDEQLEEGDYPLQLVGPDLQGREMVGQIARIVVNPDDEEVADGSEGGSSTADFGDVTLEILGAVGSPVTLSGADLSAMDVVEVTAEHPRRGEMTATGVRLNDLLDRVQPNDEATTVIIIASDGYRSEIALDQIRTCADCLVAPSEEGTLDMVMPGFTEGSAWVKDMVQIEVE